MSLREAIDYYHENLTDELGAESQHQLETLQRRRNLYFGERPLCTVLRPRFLTGAQYRFLQERCALLLSAFDTAHRAALKDSRFRQQFRLMEWEEELVAADPMREHPSPLSRLDAFFDTEGKALHFTEFNAETPAGPAYNDALAELFLALPAMRPFLERYEARAMSVRSMTLHALLRAFMAWRGQLERPRIAIVDWWREVPTYSEFQLFEQFFKDNGLDCVIADPREIEYRDGKLMSGDYHITLIYKRVLISELIERCGIEHAIVRAVREGAVCMVDSFACKILHKKASLAVLSDERNATLFSAEERATIEAHIPWTRVVEERSTMVDGRKVALLDYIGEQREQMVLKPNDEYGGKGIVLGWEVSHEEWSRAVSDALASPTIVQRRITLPSEPYPSVANGKVHIADRMLDTAPYAFDGKVDGCLTRLSTAMLLNVTAGGGSTVPTLVIEAR
jgi:uncharacterized circularly permuted ATP-grasp superfamily protein